MSHSKLRSEKICLNCGAEVPRHYCPECGQENVEPKQTLWHLVVHFFNDITHFDGKFFHTFKKLLFKPGHLSTEYVRGRRQQYLDPIRMYLFISAAFFILFSAVVTGPESLTKKDAAAIDYIDSVRKTHAISEGLEFTIIDLPDGDKKASLFDVGNDRRHGYRYYDSVQASLPANKRDGWFNRYTSRSMIGAYQNYDANPYNFVPNVIHDFLHSFSKIFFISLPIFAFFLFLLNITRRRQYYYVSHAIFTLHYYCIVFIFYTVLMGIYYLPFATDGPLEISILVILLGMLAYLYFAMLRFYKQDWFKTLIKFILLSCVFGITFITLVGFLLFHSIATGH